jgi:hypothetical protein
MASFPTGRVISVLPVEQQDTPEILFALVGWIIDERQGC